MKEGLHLNAEIFPPRLFQSQTSAICDTVHRTRTVERQPSTTTHTARRRGASACIHGGNSGRNLAAARKRAGHRKALSHPRTAVFRRSKKPRAEAPDRGRKTKNGERKTCPQRASLRPIDYVASVRPRREICATGPDPGVWFVFDGTGGSLEPNLVA